ncbi:acyl carrier protein [Helicobacter sp. faydin-H20]|uniref:acyl carrier protein n=1 Tax=Helicobacter anatolicus TaxID=2905874 RepID=UPI001E5226D5|nr:acyl carrier protein [Helicobacter anatolicus]MCE3037128.1 acyl carrier protein [Helicobacter anatolicus]MCE3038664.1 acyl carrier protein [Helicobacter anatolicus]
MTNNIQEKLQEIFRDVFDDENLEITPQTSASDIDEWDSLMHISLVSSIEKAFKIRFALGELQDLKNIGDMIALIEKKV